MMKVSVIVPVYNAAADLERAVRSVLDQTMPDFELILVDDGSTDGSAELCDKLQSGDSRIVVIHQQNSGQGSARNAGIEISRGDYLSFVDADDYILPEMLSELTSAAEHYGADLVLGGMAHSGGNLFAKDVQSGLTPACGFTQIEEFPGVTSRNTVMLGMIGAEPYEKEDSRYNFSACKNLYRAEPVRTRQVRFEAKRPAFCEDLLFSLAFLRYSTMSVGIPGIHYVYCNNTASTTHVKPEGVLDRFSALYDTIFASYRDLIPEEDLIRYLDRMFESKGRVCSVLTVRQGLPYRETLTGLRTVSAHPRLQEVLRRYPYWQLPRTQALFAFAMRYQLAALQYALIRAKEKSV